MIAGVRLLRCLGRAVVKHGGKALCGLVPFGEVVFEVARDAYEEYRRDGAEAELRGDLERLARSGPDEVRQAAEAAAGLAAAGQTDEVRQAVAAYLARVPAAVRQSLRRPSDPGGTTVPPGMALRGGNDLLPFLPVGLPRFRPGDRPLAADWELVELLGKGGFGEVWKARHLHQSRKRPVALKFCLDPVAAATLRNEAALHDQLDRVREGAAPGIVPLLETYLGNDPPCLMYEYIEGGDLMTYARELLPAGRLTAALATRLVARLAAIVASAHRLDPPLVHRDLKPSNTLLRRSSGELPELLVADFGIGGLAAGQALREHAAHTGSARPLPSALRGACTPLYASPQQARGEPPDPRDDVHALGVLWYQLVAGDLALLAVPPDWRDVVEERGLDETHTRLLASCLASRAERRLASAVELARQLGEPPAPSAPSVPVVPRPPETRPVPPSPPAPADGERRLAALVRDALQRSGGRPTPADHAAAAALVRQVGLAADRAAAILGAVQREWRAPAGRPGPCEPTPRYPWSLSPEPPELANAEFLPALTREVALDSITLHEPGSGRTLLDGVSLRIPAGARLAVVGEDDLSLHALLALLPRFVDPTRGSVRIDGHDLRHVTHDTLRAQIGAVWQRSPFSAATAMENLLCGEHTFSSMHVYEAAKQAHAHRVIARLPAGYQTPLGDGGALTASERFRLALARAALIVPALLLVEEPAEESDVVSASLEIDACEALAAGCTTVFLARRAETVEGADRVVLLHGGRLEADGDHATLLSANVRYRRLFERMDAARQARAASPAGSLGGLRLTLRTLLSYLDDQLEDAQVARLGRKVRPNEYAMELVNRLRRVLRRRRLLNPADGGPGQPFDANTVAEYLDLADLPIETITAVETACLEDDTRLAEVAACHQMLTNLLADPAAVPPAARERMRRLVGH